MSSNDNRLSNSNGNGGNASDAMSSSSTSSSSTAAGNCGNGGGKNGQTTEVQVRTKLPVPQPDRSNINLWSFLKTCIGKELSKITMPVQWNEPISLLQRFSEQMTYAQLLDRATESAAAAVASESEEAAAVNRMQWVAAFAVSSLSPNVGRMSKPFNPLLGETFQLKRDNFRVLFEQVGHHPPVSAFYAEGRHYAYRGSVCPKTKFYGKSVQFQPMGPMRLDLKHPQHPAETYTWNLIPCVVHNIILGKLWMEQVGTMDIVNQRTKHKCALSFKSGCGKSGWFTDSANAAEDMHAVEGFVVDAKNRKVSFLYGRWTEYMCAAPADAALAEFFGVSNLDKVDANAANLPNHPTLLMGAVPNSTVLWQAAPISDEAVDSYYHFSSFAMGLNQPLPAEEQGRLCRTDSRNRPDVRALEEGDLELAAAEKERLENKQRDYRKPFGKKSESEWWTPRWFVQEKDEYNSKQDDWKYVGGYWEHQSEQNADGDTVDGGGGNPYKNVPDIF